MRASVHLFSRHLFLPFTKSSLDGNKIFNISCKSSVSVESFPGLHSPHGREVRIRVRIGAVQMASLASSTN